MPTDLAQMLGGAIRTGEMPPVVLGRVVRAPADLSDSFEVVLPNVDSTGSYEVPSDHWCGVVLPHLNDPVLVFFDETQDAWAMVTRHA
jgi:hypothetical protein